MASATVFDLLSQNLNKTLEKILIPKFSEVAAEVAMNFGDEPPSKESMAVLFEDAFKKIMSSPKKPASPKKEKVVKPKVTKPKKAKTPAPKSKWVSKKEMEDLLIENEGQKYFCGFVADRGPNKGKFCACELTTEAKNCGTMSDDKEWTPHSPDEEITAVGGEQNKVRCKSCWAAGKNGAYRKIGGFDKLYNKVDVESPKPKKKSAKKEKKQDEVPEVPESPVEDSSSDVIEPKDEEPQEDEEKYENETDNEEESDNEDNESTEDILDGLLD